MSPVAAMRRLAARRRRRRRTPMSDRPPAAVVRRRYHAHLPAVSYVTICVFLGLGAVNAQNNLLFLVFGIALATLIVSGLLSGTMMMSIEVRREAIGQPAVGARCRIRYEVRNTHPFVPVFAVSLTERPERADRSILPRVVAFVAHVPPRSAVIAEAHPVPAARGVLTLDQIDASTGFPFGIIRKSVRLSSPEQLIVHPEVRRLAPGALPPVLSRGRADAEARSERVGGGLEFYGLREYRPGDPARMMAWAAIARTGQLITRQHVEDASRSVTIVLDLAGAEPGDDPGAHRDRVEGAVSLAASLLAHALRDGRRVGLRAPTHGIDFPPSIGRGRLEVMLDALAMLRVDPADAPAPPRPATGAGVLVVTTRANAHAPQVLTPDDMARLDLEARDAA